MRKTTEYKAENRLTVDIEGLMAMLSCGEAVSYTHLDVYKRQDCRSRSLLVAKLICVSIFIEVRLIPITP